VSRGSQAAGEIEGESGWEDAMASGFTIGPTHQNATHIKHKSINTINHQSPKISLFYPI